MQTLNDLAHWQAGPPVLTSPRGDNLAGGVLVAVGCLFLAGVATGVGWAFFRRWFRRAAARFAAMYGRVR